MHRNSYPESCIQEESGTECIRGQRLARKSSSALASLLLFPYVIVTILVSLSMTVCKVAKVERALNAIRTNAPPALFSDEIIKGKHKNTKLVIVKALAYVLAPVMTVMLPQFFKMGRVRGKGADSSATDSLKLVFFRFKACLTFSFLWAIIL